eukprot:705716-Prorocentrum_minimum.AAC.1
MFLSWGIRGFFRRQDSRQDSQGPKDRVLIGCSEESSIFHQEYFSRNIRNSTTRRQNSTILTRILHKLIYCNCSEELQLAPSKLKLFRTVYYRCTLCACVCLRDFKCHHFIVCNWPSLIITFGAKPMQAPESTVGQPMAVYRQGIYVEYSMEYSKCCALNGMLVSTVDDCRLLN